MIGKRIGSRYEVLKYIGSGGMSRVYLAHDVILDRDVAIKVLNYDFSNEEELKRRFMREALSATSLTHPNIVDIFDVGEDGNLHYLVMEYVAGQTLKEFIVSNGPLSPEEALPIMQQLVSAISNAHYNGIIHRDIKPQNILMDHDGNVKITDFGIAMALSATTHTKTNSVLGTVHYLSPEQARGRMATKKSDIYSVGIVFYELLIGKLPFSGESAVSIALKHLQEETPSVREAFPDIPQSVENVILKATAKDPTIRYQSADEMQDDMATVLLASRMNEEKFAIHFDDEATRAMPAIKDEPTYENIGETIKHEPIQQESEPKPEPEPKPKPKKKRKKGPLIVGGLVAVALIIALIAFLPNLLGWKKIDVPDVVDMSENEAIEKLEKDGFKIKESVQKFAEDVETGKVIQTNPQAGKLRQRGSEITLYVSAGKELVATDSYIGDNFKQVVPILENQGFKVEFEDIYSDEAAGIIIEQDPVPGTEMIPSETVLRFKVSKGAELVTVQNLKGFTEDRLNDYAESSGLTVLISDQVYSNSVPEGQVISQKPATNAEVGKGGEVKVVLSKGEEPKKQPVKLIIQTVKIQYVADDNGKEEKQPQTVRVYVEDRNRSMTDIYEEFTITEDENVTIKMELEEGGRSAYRILRDNVQIEEKTFNYKDVE